MKTASAYSAVRNTHRRMMGTYINGSTTEIRRCCRLMHKHLLGKTQASQRSRGHLPIRIG